MFWRFFSHFLGFGDILIIFLGLGGYFSQFLGLGSILVIFSFRGDFGHLLVLGCIFFFL